MPPESAASTAPEEGRDSVLPLAIAAALLFPLLAGLRHLDDNSLTSWAWVLAGRDVVGIWVIHIGVVLAAALLARTALPGRWRLPSLIATAFLAAIALHSEPEAVIDASRYFVQAKHLALFGAGSFLRAWGHGIPAWTDLPLVPFLYGTVFRVFGEHRVGAQLFTAGLFALTVFATERIGRRLWDAGTGRASGMLLLAAPCLLVQVPLLMTDVPAMCAVTLALWGFIAVISGGGVARGIAAATAIAAALLTKYSTWVLLASALGAILLITAAQRRWGAAARGLAAAAGGALAPLAFVLLKPDVVARQVRLLTDFQWEGLRRWGESYGSTFLFQVHPLVALLALVGLLQAWKTRDARVLLVACVPAVLLALQVRRTRYLLPALPMIALVAARGLAALGGERRRRFALLSAAGFSLVTVFALYLPFLRWTNTANLREAGRFLDARGVRAAEVSAVSTPGVLINPETAIPLLDYHTAAHITRRDAGPMRPADEDLRTSSFRFTWEDRLPPWYDAGPEGASPAAQVLITGDPEASPPPAVAARTGGRPPDAGFVRDAVFRFRTLVFVFLPP